MENNTLLEKILGWLWRLVHLFIGDGDEWEDGNSDRDVIWSKKAQDPQQYCAGVVKKPPVMSSLGGKEESLGDKTGDVKSIPL